MSAEVNELRDSARQVMAGCGLAAAEGETWTLIAELGWLMVSVPEELGGLGMGLDAACALHLEMGRGLATAPCLSAMLGIEALCLGEDIEGRDGLLERLLSGEDYLAAPLVGSTLLVDAGRLTGTALAVPSADRAGHVLACAADTVALVPVDAAELTFRPTWDETRRLFDVRLDDVALDPALVLAQGDAARALAARLAVVRDFALAADAAGGAAALLELTVDYLQTRRQYGRPLALFQALKHRCADLKAQTEAAEALLLDNLGRLGKGDDGRLARAARLLACGAYASVAEEALQLHGGIGMTAEHVCHLFLKRAMLDEHLGAGHDSDALDLAARLLGAPA